MHIVHIAAFAGLGGVERRLIEYVSEVDDGNKHTLIAIDPAADVEEMLAASDCKYQIVRRRVRIDPTFPLRLAWLIKRHSPDVIYCRGFTSALWVSLGPPIFRSVQRVRSEHGSLIFHGKLRRLLERFINWRFDKVVTVSSAMAVEINVRLGVPKDDIEVISYGLVADDQHSSLRVGKSENSSDGYPVIGTIANFHSIKNIISLVDSAPAILDRYPDCRFVLVGGDVGSGNSERFRARIRELGVEDSFVFTGQLADARQALSTFDVFVLPSVFESFGAVVVEAMLAGVPVIAADIGAMRELIEDGINGVLVEPTEPFKSDEISTVVSPVTGQLEPARAVGSDALASAVIKMIGNLGEWTEIAKSVQEEASQRFSFGAYQDRMAAFYRRAVE